MNDLHCEQLSTLSENVDSQSAKSQLRPEVVNVVELTSDVPSRIDHATWFNS